MKTFGKLKLIGIIIVLISSFSCSNSDRPDGDWDDNIKLSQREAKLTAEYDSIVITTEGKWWWIHNISLNGDSNFDLSGIDTTEKNFIVEEAEFKIERKNTTEIHIEMTKNQTDSERVLIIGLEAGDYFDSIVITQSAN
jgi:pectate lyase